MCGAGTQGPSHLGGMSPEGVEQTSWSRLSRSSACVTDASDVSNVSLGRCPPISVPPTLGGAMDLGPGVTPSPQGCPPAPTPPAGKEAGGPPQPGQEREGGRGRPPPPMGPPSASSPTQDWAGRGKQVGEGRRRCEGPHDEILTSLLHPPLLSSPRPGTGCHPGPFA